MKNKNISFCAKKLRLEKFMPHPNLYYYFVFFFLARPQRQRKFNDLAPPLPPFWRITPRQPPPVS